MRPSAKYVVVKVDLLESLLLERACFDCQVYPTKDNIKKSIRSTLATFKTTCSKCKKETSFATDVEVQKKPALALALTTSTLTTGCQAEKIMRLFEACQIACYSRTTMYDHNVNSVVPTVNMVSLSPNMVQ